MEITAAVTNAKDDEFKVSPINLDAPKFGEVLIRIVASGICHTDLMARSQGWPVPLPAVLGHEGAGVVEEVGDGVTEFQPGDHVVMSPASCGKCAQCLEGRPYVCNRFYPLNYEGKMDDGTYRHHNQAGGDISNFFGQSSFGSHTVANARNVVKVDKDVDLNLLGPLGCGIETGAGTVFNRIRPELGSSIAVFGTGSVGMSAIMAAHVAGAATIIAVDVHDSRLDLAMELGATHTINAREVSVPDTIKKIVPEGLNYAIETAGAPGTLRQCVDSLGPRGVAYQVAAPAIGSEDSIDVNDVLLANKTITGVVQGDSVPKVFIPKLVALYKDGKLPIDKLCTFYSLDEINQAADDSLSGKTVKAIIRME